jgi:8-oxo-dGTP pyrophosphatase MutT (NUDIX family)
MVPSDGSAGDERVGSLPAVRRGVPPRGGDQVVPTPPGTRPGGPPPWHGRHGAPTFAEVLDRLATLPPPPPPPDELAEARPSAVLVPIFPVGDEAHLVLTKRPDHLRSHAGEIAFPGGKRDPDDPSLLATALREAEEEVGIDPAAVRVLAELPTIGTVRGVVAITPYVGVLDERPELRARPGEVEDAFTVALADLLDPEAWYSEQWSIFDREFDMAFYLLPGETVWGATARILTGLLAHLTAG